MPDDFTCMWNLKNKTKQMTKQQKQTHDTENILTVARWGEVGGMSEREEGIKKYELVVTEQSWDVKYSIKNTVKNTVMAIWCWMGTRCIGVITL